ncbi:uncharacterized protein DEA37_0009627 [Paragonimus westermani]|uniref:Uncharacterized protein n=1 Tax=Paragonimus westermani TaxID=34504 RepID=A0A5J4P171_9TREM|nr:uncharacterized protein DEA37_0009627 [Paragonimus westermani]
MHTVYIVLLIVVESFACPLDLVHMGSGICVLEIVDRVNYCDAHRLCKLEGQKRGLRLLVIGTNVSKIVQFIVNSTHYPTRIHSLLSNRKASRNLWQTHEAKYTLKWLMADELNWADTEPAGDGEQIVVVFDANLHDRPQDIRNRPVLCELSTDPPSDRTGITLFRGSTPLQPFENFMDASLSTGCFLRITSTTILLCGFK